MTTFRQHALVACLYGLVAIALLAPLASNTYLTWAPDHANHTAVLAQARMAIEDGQFPIQVAPWQFRGWLLPLYAFYSPFAYEVAGRVYRWLSPGNPYIAYKITLWMALVCGGYFFYLTAWRLLRLRGASILAGLAYMSAPYVLVNVHARGAFTEVVGQGLLPLVLYCAWRCYEGPWRSPWVFASAISWGLLALTHNITYLASGAWINGMFLLLAFGWRGPRAGFWRTTAACALGVLLGIHLLVADVLGHQFLQIRDWLTSLPTSNWVTALPTLTSLHSLPPELRPGVRPVSPHLSPGIGWPALLAAGLVVGLRKGPSTTTADTLRLRIVLVLLFLLAIFVTWSPYNFWPYLPSMVSVVQFTYRFLTQVAWIGALLVGLALARLYGGSEMPRSHLVIGAILILFAHASYLPRAERAPNNALEVIEKTPDIGYGQGAYLAVGLPDVIPATDIGLDVAATEPHCQRSIPAGWRCQLSLRDKATLVQLPQLYYPDMLETEIDGREVPTVPVAHANFVLAGVRMDPGAHEVDVRFRGVRWANRLAAAAWILALAGLVMPRGLAYRGRGYNKSR